MGESGFRSEVMRKSKLKSKLKKTTQTKILENNDS